MDGNPALLKALREVYSLTRLQRCIAHKLRNVVVKLKRARREACMGEAKRMFGAPSRTEAIRRFRAWRTNWLDETDAAVRCLERNLFHCFHYFRFPQHLWKTIRTTNILEQAFREVRRRTQRKARLHECRVGGKDHVRGDRASQRELAGASPSPNSAGSLT